MRRAGVLSLLFVLLIATSGALACTAPPTELVTPYTELIDRTATIVLAETVRAEEIDANRVRYEFRVVESVKGSTTSKLSLTFQRDDWMDGPLDHDFDQHRHPTFWDQRATRVTNGSDCQMHPTFFVGSRYLLFVNRPYHWRSFERITAPRDRWLTIVRARVNKGEELSQTVIEWLRDKPTLALYRVERCPLAVNDRPVLKHIETLKGLPPLESDWYAIFTPLGGCRSGSSVFAIHYRSYGERFIIVYPIVDGAIDLTHAKTEIKLQGPRRIPLADVKAFLQ